MLVADVDSPFSIAAGIVVGLLASCVQSLGLTIQRKSHVINQQLPEHEQRADHRRPLWLLGFAIFISSNILGSFFQIASLPVVILAPLGAVSLLWNAFFARFLLGDVFSWWMLLGTVLIAGGAVLVGIFGIVPEPTHSLEDLLLLFRRSAFIAYFTLLGAGVVVWLAITHIAEFSLRRNAQTPPFSPPMVPGPLESAIPPSFAPPPSHIFTVSESTPLLDRKPSPTRPSTPLPIVDHKTARTRLFVAVSYASVSGILSGMCLIFAKSGVELLLLTIRGNNQFWRWEAWMLLLGLVAFALLQLWYLQKSLVFADPTIICPLAFCFYNISSIVNGLIYFDQISLLSSLQLSLVSVGMGTLLGGVWLVSFHAGSGRVDVGTWQEGDNDLEEEEEEVHVAVEEPTDYPSPLYSPLGLEAGQSDFETPRASSFSPHTITFPLSPDVTEQDDERLARSLTRSPSTSRVKVRGRRRRRFSILQHSESTMPGGGFSIGLSPASPGFSIVPKGRAKHLRAVVDRAAMRRTVSESDADHTGRNGAQASTSDGQPFPPPPATTEGNGDSHVQRFKAQARWKWLRRIITDRDS